MTPGYKKWLLIAVSFRYRLAPHTTPVLKLTPGQELARVTSSGQVKGSS